MRHLGLETAREALACWGGDARTLAHVATSGNSVYRFARAGESYVLRLTDPSHRSLAENEAELAFLRHLTTAGVSIAEPVASRDGLWVEAMVDCSASVFRWVEGETVDWNSPHWDAPFFRTWGRSLAAIHRAAKGYAGPARWDWREERLLRDAEELFPADDHLAREEFALTVAQLEALPRTGAGFGMIHADFAPQNFRYLPGRGITSFDFGNCCQHWFAQDLAISLLYFRRDARRDLFRRELVAGYREVLPIDEESGQALGWFMRLRILYVYLSRLRKFGQEPTQEERAILSNLRLAVAERFEWPEEARR